MRRWSLLLLLATVPVFGGCVDDDPTADGFPDAALRFTDQDAGPHVFEVPEGNVTLVVAVHYVLESDASFESVLVLAHPETHLAGLDQIGPVEEKDPRWAVVRNATAGTWRIEAGLSGPGAYAFGVDFEGVSHE